MATRIQHRAICSICFREQAVHGKTFLAHHGYRIGWGQQVGNCAGAGREHFGSAKGRDHTIKEVTDLLEEAGRLDLMAKAEDIKVYGRKFNGPLGRSVDVLIEDPKPWQIKGQRDRLAHQARTLRSVVDELRGHINRWKPMEPREVEVERSGP